AEAFLAQNHGLLRTQYRIGCLHPSGQQWKSRLKKPRESPRAYSESGVPSGKRGHRQAHRNSKLKCETFESQLAGQIRHWSASKSERCESSVLKKSTEPGRGLLVW